MVLEVHDTFWRQCVVSIRRNGAFGDRFAFLVLVVMLFSCMLVPVFAVSGVYAAAPFAFSVSPKSVSAKAGDTVSYHAVINASAGFSGAISFSLAITAVGYNATLNLGTVNPPYPKQYDFSFMIPSDVPVSVTLQGVVTGTSGGFSQTDTVQISIQSQSSGGDPLSWLTNLFSGFWNWLMRLLGRT